MSMLGMCSYVADNTAEGEFQIKYMKKVSCSGDVNAPDIAIVKLFIELSSVLSVCIAL